MKIDSKLPNVGTTIFTVMSQLAAEHKSINLGQGFPDFNPDEQLVQLTFEAMKAGHNQYPPMPGVETLRKAVINKISTLYGHAYNPANEITVTSGATEALMVSIQALIDAGDEAIVIEPMYDLYVPAIELAGGKAITVSMTVPTRSDETYSIDWNKIESAISPKTRLLILNTPHNPTGMTLSDKDLDALESLLKKHPFFVISDEVYEHIVFGEKPHLSLSSRQAIAERAVVISSFGKTYHVTGWKIGYCVAPEYLMTEIRKIHQFTVFTVNTPIQVALAQYISDPSTYAGLSNFYEQKRNYLSKGLERTRLQGWRSDSTFFMLANYKNIADVDENTFVRWLTIEKGVTAIPMAAFYREPMAKASNHHMIRLCFAKHESTLDAALERLANLDM